MFYPTIFGGERWTCTTDTLIFSQVLYFLSYLSILVAPRRIELRLPGWKPDVLTARRWGHIYGCSGRTRTCKQLSGGFTVPCRTIWLRCNINFLAGEERLELSRLFTATAVFKTAALPVRLPTLNLTTNCIIYFWKCQVFFKNIF